MSQILLQSSSIGNPYRRMTPRTVGGLNNSQSEHQVATWLLYRSLLPLSRILAVIQEFYMPSIIQQHQLSTPYHAQSSR